MKKVDKRLQRSIDNLIREHEAVTIDTKWGSIFTLQAGPVDGQPCFLLHGYGRVTGFYTWRYMYGTLAAAGYRVIGIDFPGFGSSEGKRFASRYEQIDKPISFLTGIKKKLGFGKKKAIIIGYDWGASIAAEMATKKDMAEKIVMFHSSTIPIKTYQSIKCPTLMLWVKVDQFHPYKNCQIAKKNIPNCKVVTLKVESFTQDKAKGNYEIISPKIRKQILDFLQKDSLSKDEEIVEEEEEEDEVRVHIQGQVEPALSTVSTVYSSNTIIEEGISEEVKSLYSGESELERIERESKEDEDRLNHLKSLQIPTPTTSSPQVVFPPSDEEGSSEDEQKDKISPKEEVIKTVKDDVKETPVVVKIKKKKRKKKGRPKLVVSDDDPRTKGEIWPRSTKIVAVEPSLLTASEEHLLTLIPLSRRPYAFNLTITLCNVSYTIRTWFLRKLDSEAPEKIAISMHGYGKGSTKHQFHQVTDAIASTHSVLLITLPGFGLSTGATLQTSRYKRESTYMLRSIIECLGSPKVNVIAQCGGGGVFFRTLCEYPHLFAKRHFLGRPYSAIMPENMLSVLKHHGMTLWVYWLVDCDHMTCCVPYKTLKKLSEQSKRVRLDTETRPYSELTWLPLRSVVVPNLSRSVRDEVYVYDPSHQCLEELSRYFSS